MSSGDRSSFASEARWAESWRQSSMRLLVKRCSNATTRPEQGEASESGDWVDPAQTKDQPSSQNRPSASDPRQSLIRRSRSSRTRVVAFRNADFHFCRALARPHAATLAKEVLANLNSSNALIWQTRNEVDALLSWRTLVPLRAPRSWTPIDIKQRCPATRVRIRRHGLTTDRRHA